MPGKQMKSFLKSISFSSRIFVVFIALVLIVNCYSLGVGCTAGDCETDYPNSEYGAEFVGKADEVGLASTSSSCDDAAVSPATIKLISVPDPDAHWPFRTDTIYTFEFDENVFSFEDEDGDSLIIEPGVTYITMHTGQTVMSCAFSGSDCQPFEFIVNLKNPNELTSEQIENEKLTIRTVQSRWHGSTVCVLLDSTVFDSPEKTLEIKIKKGDDDEISFEEVSSSGGAGPGSSSSSCSTCPSGGASGGGMSIGNEEVNIFSEQEDTLNFNSSVFQFGGKYYPEINVGGVWIKPHSDFMAGTGWSSTEVEYVTSGNEVTKVWYDVIDPTGLEYKYELEGSWTGDDVDEAKAAACEAIEGGVDMELQTVTDTVNSTTLKSYTYTQPASSGGYDYRDITVAVGSGGLNRYVVYQMKKKTSTPDPDPDYRLARIWMGTSTSGITALGSTPSSGRWVDIETEYMLESGIPLITESGCISCGAVRKGYDYVAGNVNKDGAIPTRHLVSKVKSIDSQSIETILASYEYDSRDRLSKRWLGDKDGSGKLAMEAAQDDTTRLQKDYVDDSQYRATVALYDNYGRITERRHYHDLQTSSEPTGTFSRTMYKTEADTSNNLTKETTILPKGNTFIKEYDSSSGRVTKRLRNSVVQAEYDYENTTKYYNYPVIVMTEKLNESKGANGKSTSYSYEQQEVANYYVITKQTVVEPAPGVFGKTAPTDQPTTSYYYDLLNRVTRQEVSGNTPTTYYDYDAFGNLTEQIYDGVTTNYAYNEYNEQTLTYQAVGTTKKNIVKTKYDQYGRLEEQYSYDTYNNATADVLSGVISGTAYVYDGDGRLSTKKTVVDYVASALTFALEEYEYDSYGRKTMVTVDPSGEDISTTYEYNYQGEVTKVNRPDGSSTTTVRDGRGLVSQVINAKSTNSSTTKYYYDLNGNLTKQEDPEGVCDFYKYDTLDRKILHRRGK